MAEENTPPATDGEGGTGNAGGGEDSGAKKALDAERAARRKAEQDAKAARDELAKLQGDMQAGKTDAERTAAMLAELRERADAADLRAMRAEVAANKGLTSAQAKRLQGKTIEELEADADELLAAFKPAEGGAEGDAGATNGGAQRPATGAGRPRENLRAGTATGTEKEPEYDSAKFLAALPRG